MHVKSLLTVGSMLAAATACYQCHTAQKDKDFVFSAWRP